MKIVFSVLHFRTFATTIECVNSLLELDGYGNDIKAIILDNGSNDGSGEKIRNYYRNNDHVIVIICKKNRGFAKGNNISYKYAKNMLHPDSIVVLNNDTFIKQKDFIIRLKKAIDNNSEASIIAPDIINRNGLHQNPVRTYRMTGQEMFFILAYNLLVYVIMCFPFLNSAFIMGIEKYHSINIKQRISEKNRNIDYESVVPHGAAIIYLRRFINNEEKAFCPYTFLYCEEELLYEYALQKKYRIVYDESLKIHHIEDVATNSITMDACKKKKMISKYKIQSIRILIVYRFLKSMEW